MALTSFSSQTEEAATGDITIATAASASTPIPLGFKREGRYTIPRGSGTITWYARSKKGAPLVAALDASLSAVTQAIPTGTGVVSVPIPATLSGAFEVAATAAATATGTVCVKS